MRFTLLLTGLALFSLTCTSVAVAQPSFSNADLEGRYALATDAGFGLEATGVFTADGNGNISNGIRIIEILLLGPPSTHTFSGTYTVNPDGTGTANLVSPDPYPGIASSTGSVRWSLCPRRP